MYGHPLEHTNNSLVISTFTRYLLLLIMQSVYGKSFVLNVFEKIYLSKISCEFHLVKSNGLSRNYVDFIP